jgi:hypothetical protein
MLTVIAVSTSFIVIAGVSYFYGLKKGAANANKSVDNVLEALRNGGSK